MTCIKWTRQSEWSVCRIYHFICQVQHDYQVTSLGLDHWSQPRQHCLNTVSWSTSRVVRHDHMSYWRFDMRQTNPIEAARPTAASWRCSARDRGFPRQKATPTTSPLIKKGKMHRWKDSVCSLVCGFEETRMFETQVYQVSCTIRVWAMTNYLVSLANKLNLTILREGLSIPDYRRWSRCLTSSQLSKGEKRRATHCVPKGGKGVDSLDVYTVR